MHDDTPFCYSGSKMGEAVTIRIHKYDHAKGVGAVFVTGSGLAPVRCHRDFSKTQQLLDVPGLEHCLPRSVKPAGMRYCSDQDQLLLDAKVSYLAVELVLKPSPCPAVLLEEGSRNDLLSHSAWVWDATGCTGSGGPPSRAPFCFTGSKMGEIVTIRVNSFDNASSTGSVHVSGSGLAPVKCQRSFSKAQQLITVDKLADCLPATVKPESMKYCSDQNQVLLNAHVGIVPVQMALIPSPCAPHLMEDKKTNGAALVEMENEWTWGSNACTGSGNPATHAPFCYSGSKLGETVTIRVHKFDNNINQGLVFVSGSGLARVHCKRDFSKAQQMIEVPGLEHCLPRTVKPSGMKYCSDQDQVVLDATVGIVPVEMFLKPTPCPAAFLEEGPSTKLMRKQTKKQQPIDDPSLEIKASGHLFRHE